MYTNVNDIIFILIEKKIKNLMFMKLKLQISNIIMKFRLYVFIFIFCYLYSYQLCSVKGYFNYIGYSLMTIFISSPNAILRRNIAPHESW